MAKVTISTVTPVYNGQKYLPKLVEELKKLKVNIDQNYDNIDLVQSIFVLDEPKDDSKAVLLELTEGFPWINILTLSTNFGQHPATICGILHTSGDWIVTLDEDLQHPPSSILQLLKIVAMESDDICYANPEKSTHKSIMRDWVSIKFKQIMGYLAQNENIRYFNSFRVIRGDIARAAASICRHETYFDIALGWFSKRVCNYIMPLKDIRNITNSKESGYSAWGLVRHAKRMLMSSKLKFLRVGIPLGLFSFFISICLTLFALGSLIMNIDTVLSTGWTSTILTVLFFGGLTSLLSGFILETVSEILQSVNGKPTFFVIDRSKDSVINQELEGLEI